jgi:tetratricopeptide (TPR) repeat protein
VARHKAGVAAALLLLVTLAAGIAATAWPARVAAAQRDRARLAAAEAQRINAFLQDMLGYSSPAYLSPNPRKNPDARVSEVVEEAAQRAETELADQPEVLAEMQRTIGAVYYAQGRYDQAEQILRAALQKYVRLYGQDRPETVEAANVLANTLVRKGKTAEAEALFLRNIEIERREAQRRHLEVRNMAYALGDYGSMLEQRSDHAAEGYLQEALRYASTFTGRDRAFVAMLDNDLSEVAYGRGDLDKAEYYLRAALEEYRKLPEGPYVEMGATLANLGAVLIKQGKYAIAESFVRESVELRRNLLGNAHPDTAMSLFRLADLLRHQGDNGGAEAAARESVEIFKRAYKRPNETLYFAAPLTELGLALNQQGRSRKAEAYLRQSLEVRTRLLPRGNQLIGTSEGTLGECLTAQRRYSEAEPLLLDSYKVMKSTAGEHDPRTLEAAQRLTTLYQSWGKPQEAVWYRMPSR